MPVSGLMLRAEARADIAQIDVRTRSLRTTDDR
jgi:hypothetical protein